MNCTNTAIYLDDELCERVCDDFQNVWGIFSILERDGIQHEVGQELQVMGGSLQRQEHQHREPVEEVMDSGACKCPTERKSPELYYILRERVRVIHLSTHRCLV